MFRSTILTIPLLLVGVATADDWRQFRGPNSQGVSAEKNLPTKWSATENIAWKLKLPGAGASSPITLGKRIFVTCYSGYGFDKKEPGKQEDLRRHVVCVDREAGKIVWAKEFMPVLPEHDYSRHESDYHGYAASTPFTDGERLYVFFGKSGVYCLDLDGNQKWHATVGKGTNGWGSGSSPILYKDLLIVNASVESQSIYALDKLTGKEVWKAPKIGSAWGTPILSASGELVISASGKVFAFDPQTGKELWTAKGHGGYVVPSLVTHDSIIYAIGGGGTSLAIKSGGKGDVSTSHVLWRKPKGSNASSPIYHDGFLYWINSNGGVLCRQDAATGVTTDRRISKEPFLWASPVLADGKLYIVSQHDGVYVIAANEKLDEIAHNLFADDKSRSNASIAISDGQLLLRNDQHLYCIGKK